MLYTVCNELTPKNDVIFKRLFGQKGNEDLVKDFLEAVLDIEIISLELGKETELIPESINEKVGILDVKAVLNDGTTIDIEMQNIDYGNIEKRITYYLSQLYTAELSRGKPYNDLNKAIAIGILNFEYDAFKDIKDYHTVWKMTETINKKETLNEQEIHFIELPKFLKSKININSKLDQWLLFIDYSRKELLSLVKEKNDKINDAADKCEYLTGNEAVRRLAFLRRKFEHDYISGLTNAEEKGEKRGRSKEKIEIAKNFKKLGAKIEDIAVATGLSIEEIEKL